MVHGSSARARGPPRRPGVAEHGELCLASLDPSPISPAVAPLCRRASDAMKHLAEDACLFGSLHYDKWMEAYDGLRRAAAKLINASAGEIAIVKNTSEGISVIALGLDWKPGDRVVAFKEEFPANYYPWLRLESGGVKLTWLSIYDPPEKIAESLPGARLLAISHVNYLSGYRVDLQRLGELCQRRRAFTFFGAQLHARNEPAKILIAFPRFDQQREAIPVRATHFRAKMRLNASFFGGHMEAGRPVHTIAIKERHGRHAEISSRCN